MAQPASQQAKLLLNDLSGYHYLSLLSTFQFHTEEHSSILCTIPIHYNAVVLLYTINLTSSP
eukprot:scaffold26939_cov88-Skeletonema_marinoi.AAC.1